MKKCFLQFVLLFFSVSSFSQLYLAPDGDDFNPGTRDKPLATLSGVSKRILELKNNDTVSFDNMVIVKDGTYELKEPFLITKELSGSVQNPLVIRAEEDARPVFTGGRIIQGFEKNEQGLWFTDLKETLGEVRFDQLYVNGKRQILARAPDKGFFHIKDVKQTILKKGNSWVAEKAVQEIFLNDSVFDLLTKVPEKALKNVRFRIYHHWDFTVRYVDSLNYSNKSIITHGRGMKPWNPWKKGGRIVFENFKEALSEPGEWFLDDNRRLYYVSSGEDKLTDFEVTVPLLESFMNIKGDQNYHEPVKNMIFKGLTFEYCGYPMDREGFEPNQAAVSEGASVYVENAENISFMDCEIAKTGQHAVWFGKGCHDCKVEHCMIHDLGGGGIYLGGIKDKKEEDHTSRIRIRNNIIHHGGRDFPPAVGIWTGHSSDNELTHNDVGDFFYTGISVGWVWGYGPSKAIYNIIRFNNIHHIGWDLLSDMAGVYTLGKSEGTVISDNVVHHIHAYSYGGWGLYTDEGSSGILMENNLVYSTKTGGFHQHYGENNIIRNNIFAFAKLYQLQCTRVEKHLSFTFDHNIVIFNEGEVLKGPWFDIIIEMDGNIYWNTGSDSYSFAGKSFKKWKKKSGHDRHSLIVDPQFEDPEHFDFILTTEQFVRKTRFKKFDYSKAGVYGNDEWLKKAKLQESTLKKFDEAVRRNLE